MEEGDRWGESACRPRTEGQEEAVRVRWANGSAACAAAGRKACLHASQRRHAVCSGSWASPPRWLVAVSWRRQRKCRLGCLASPGAGQSRREKERQRTHTRVSPAKAQRSGQAGPAHLHTLWVGCQRVSENAGTSGGFPADHDAGELGRHRELKRGVDDRKPLVGFLAEALQGQCGQQCPPHRGQAAAAFSHA